MKDFEATYQALDDGTSAESNGANAEESSNLITDAIASGDGGNGLGVSPVVPNSLVRVTSDKECVLYTMVVLKSQRKVNPVGDIQEWEISDSFRAACRKRRYVLRGHLQDRPRCNEEGHALPSWTPLQHVRGEDIGVVQSAFRRNHDCMGPCKGHPGLHRERLRYGLPPDFECVLIEPKDGHMMNIRKALGSLYKDLLADQDGMLGGGGGDNDGGNDDDNNFFPYVSLEM